MCVCVSKVLTSLIMFFFSFSNTVWNLVFLHRNHKIFTTEFYYCIGICKRPNDHFIHEYIPSPHIIDQFHLPVNIRGADKIILRNPQHIIGRLYYLFQLQVFFVVLYSNTLLLLQPYTLRTIQDMLAKKVSFVWANCATLARVRDCVPKSKHTIAK